MAKRKLVDERSADLARHFLADVLGATDEDRTELAEAIQRVCEDFCAAIENKGDQEAMDYEDHRYNRGY